MRNFGYVLTILAISLTLSNTLFARALKRTVVADQVTRDGVTTMSNLPATVVSELINKANWGTESCNLRFFSYGSAGEVRSVWYAAIFDQSTPTPSGWVTFNAISAGQQFKLASYVDTSKLESDSRLGLDTVCW